MDVAQHDALLRRSRRSNTAFHAVAKFRAQASSAGVPVFHGTYHRAAARPRSSSARGRRAVRRGNAGNDGKPRWPVLFMERREQLASRSVAFGHRLAVFAESARCRDVRAARNLVRGLRHRSPAQTKPRSRKAFAIATKAATVCAVWAITAYGLPSFTGGPSTSARRSSSGSRRLAGGLDRLVGARRGVAGKRHAPRVARARMRQEIADRERAANAFKCRPVARDTSPAAPRHHAPATASIGAASAAGRRLFPAIRSTAAPSPSTSSNPSSSSSDGHPSR